MSKKRLVGFVVVAALIEGCGTLTEHITADANSNAQAKPIISIGQSFDEATNLLSKTGAEDISRNIGVIMYSPGGHRWFRLRDGRWLFVKAIEAGEPKQLVIETLVLGDTNTDHIKIRGLDRYPKIARLELP